MSSLFKKRMDMITQAPGSDMVRKNYLVTNKLFKYDPNYSMCKIYDWNNIYLGEIEAKVQRASTYTLAKDAVDYYIQFRPNVHPEKMYLDIYKKINSTPDDWGSLVNPVGFYMEFSDDDGEMHKWLIVGKNEDRMYVRYNALKCNWLFKWIYDGRIYSQIGVMRSRNSYNSGLWSDGMFTNPENQNSFWIPNTPYTQTIRYDTRMILSDSRIRPVTYSISKIEDTFPIGVIKYVLKQDKFNPEFDNVELTVADYYKSEFPPTPISPNTSYVVPDIPEPPVENYNISYNGSPNILEMSSPAKTLTSSLNDVELTIGGEYSWNVLGISEGILVEYVDNSILISCKKVFSLLQHEIEVQLLKNSDVVCNYKIKVVA